jgi:hypothetical protein
MMATILLMAISFISLAVCLARIDQRRARRFKRAEVGAPPLGHSEIPTSCRLNIRTSEHVIAGRPEPNLISEARIIREVSQACDAFFFQARHSLAFLPRVLSPSARVTKLTNERCDVVPHAFRNGRL